jgi:tetratricopeptide repeat protein
VGVLIEGVNVVIRNATVEERLDGGMNEYERRCPNSEFCTDGEICRVGFMVPSDARAYIETLGSLGFCPPTPLGSPDVALIIQPDGLVFPCDWLDIGSVEIGDGQSAEMAWLKGTMPSTLVAPPNWTPGSLRQVSSEQLREHEFLGSENGVEIFRNKATGEVFYVGRTQHGATPAHIASGSVRDRYDALVDELKRAGAIENVSKADYRGDLVSLHERAKQLVEDTRGEEPGALHLQGIAARLLERWDEAALVFRRVTQMRPDYASSWLELTWALASLRRFEEAETAARKAVELAPDAAALGNLAAVLLHRGKLDEARQIAQKAVKADPADMKNKAVLAEINKLAFSREPWWRRVFGNKFR